ncbi:CARDB domain-containing protein [Xylanibacter muris]|uniref:CARDB domain-containing protein n=1 Tax=Xylanibacter muris TaxID=2736290 RepID=A0ABX2AL21_9BACT|nr:CARDB domain-containing protein [Xylanibacter muris]NPD91277.1 hypothetical protein [Xylanibacter muris]
MKRLFTIAIIAMAASLTFAQAPLAKKSTASNRLERVANVETLTKKAKQAKETQAAMAEKAAVEKETSYSMLRKASVNRGLFNSIKEEKRGGETVIKGLLPGGYRSLLSNKPYKSNARKTTVQEGNVTVTTDANGIITNVTGVEPKFYQRATTGAAYYLKNQQMNKTTQSGVVTIVEDGNNVYIKDPVTRYKTGTWVKGTKNGNTITVPCRQPLDYEAEYQATTSLRWGVVTAAGKIQAADDKADAFTFTVNGNVLTLEGTAAFDLISDAYYMGVFWDDDNSGSGYGDAETVLTYDPDYVAPSTDLITLPTGAEYTGWYMNCISMSSTSETPINNQKVNVSIFGNEVYVQGLSADLPTAWIKGTMEGSTIKFGKFQYVGKYGGYDCWFVGVNPNDASFKDATATYDAQAKTITFADDVLINASADEIYYLRWFADVVISVEERVITEPTITDLTATLPYYNTFDTEEEQAQAAIYDANNDKSTFTFEKHTATGSMTARYRYSTSNNADDYIVFPGVELKAGKSYKISVDAASYSETYIERMEVVAGKEAKASQLTIPVIAAKDVATKEFITISNNKFTVEEDGTYYIAVHAISQKDVFYLYVDNFSIEELNPQAPANVDNLNVVADAQGANKATVTFTVPTQTVSGTNITEELNVVVKREGQEIYSETKAAGASVEINDDNVPKAGYYTYSVTTSYGNNASEPTTMKTYIGYDKPDIVNNITIADKSGSVALAWEAPTGGAEGYIVNPADFKYNIYPVEFIEFWGMTIPMTDYENPYATGLTETSANIAYDTNSGEHSFKYFAVTAENTTGKSDDVYTAIVTGAPYQLPLFESIATGSLSYWWGFANDSQNDQLEGGMYLGENASDGDGNCFQMVAETKGWINLQSGKIALAGTVNPTLTFDYSADISVPMTVSVITPKGEKEIATLTAGTDYAKAVISLVEFTNEDWVRVIIEGTFSAAGNAFIDNIRVYNMVDNNLVAESITATSRVSAGEDVNITVTVENQGVKTAEAGAYTVDLYRNDTKVQSLPGTALASNAKTTFAFTETTNAMTPSELIWKAVVEFADDNDQSNNTTTTVKTVIKTNNYPVATGLTGKQTDNAVSLTWNEPDMSAATPMTVTDDFESYEGFTTNAGEWTFVDVDQSPVGGFQNLDFNIDGKPCIQSKQSFWVHDITDAETWNQTYASHSGNKYLAAMFRYDDGQTDDWAISPALCGNAQTISFYARSYSSQYPEKIEILYSTGSTNTADFISVKTAEVVPAEWTEYTAELPAGAKYFAIRSCAVSSFMLMIDDVTYETSSVPTDLAIVGYNIYRDGVKLNANPVEEAKYNDTDVTEGEHQYAVTVVYDKGESKISDIITVSVANGINGIAANAANISVSKQTITVTNAEGENVSVHTMDGKTVYNAEGATVTNIRVENGVYIVKVGKNVVKTVVK